MGNWADMGEAADILVKYFYRSQDQVYLINKQKLIFVIF